MKMLSMGPKEGIQVIIFGVGPFYNAYTFTINVSSKGLTIQRHI